MMRTNPDEVIDLFRLAKIHQRRYNLESFETAILRDMQATVNTARKQIVRDLETSIKSTSTWSRNRANEILEELDDLSLGLRRSLGETLTTASAHVGSTGMQDAYDTLSVNGLGKAVNNVALSPSQFKQFLAVNPIQGLLIPQWVDRAYTAGVRDQLQEAMLTQLQVGALRGEGYAKIVRRLEDGFGQFSKRELTSLTRTFFQSAQVRAQQAVMEANSDIIEGWIWTVAADDRCCILCIPLSENFYAKDEQHPEIPRHVRCRCFPRAKTVSFRSLGLDIDELEPIEQAVVARGRTDEKGRWVVPPVGTGGAPIQSVRFHKGGIKQAFPDMPEAQQVAMIGKGRVELLKSGKISLDDLVDKRTGKLVLLDELKAGRLPTYPVKVPPVPAAPSFVPAETVAEAEEWARRLGVKADYSNLTDLEANEINRGLDLARNRGMKMPESIQVDGDLFKKGWGIGDPGEVVARAIDGKIVQFNDLSPLWDTSSPEWKNLVDQKWWSVPSKSGITVHEVAHINHRDLFLKQKSQDEWMRWGKSPVPFEKNLPLTDAESVVRKRNPEWTKILEDVGGYAGESRAEFVAEVTSGVLHGKKYSDSVMKLFRDCLGDIEWFF